MENQADFKDVYSEKPDQGFPQGQDQSGWSDFGEGSGWQVPDSVRIFDHLLVPARLLAAAVQGNLQALSGNLHTWNQDVLSRFLSDARDDLDQMATYLELGLVYSKAITETAPYNLPVPVFDLIHEIISEQGITSVNTSEIQSDDGEPLQVNIDRAMVKIALAFLLREAADRNTSGQQSALKIFRRDESVVLQISNPRILPLPGLAAAADGEGTVQNNLELFLAQKILAAQGGNLVLDQRSDDGGGGLKIEVSLPSVEPPRGQPNRKDWGQLVKKGSGRILLVENQPEYQLRIREALTELGYRVDLAVDGNTALDMVQAGQPKLVILARNLPGMDGLLVTQGVRRWSKVPIIMISIRHSLDDLLNAYKLGVDDYLKKPFMIEELLAKVRVFLSREEAAGNSIVSEIYQEGSIRIDQGTRQVWVRGNLVQLTPIEYNLLVHLSRQGRQIIPYEQLLEHVWEGPEKGTRQGLFVHVRRLREKIEIEPKNPQILTNKWGVGYVFNP